MKLELVNEPLRATQTIAICDLEDTMITINKKTYLFPVINTSNFEQIGYYLLGDIYLGADTIINTSKGAVGDPIEKLGKSAFVKCDDIDLTHTKSEDVSEKDFRRIEINAYRFFEKLYKNQISANFKIELDEFKWDNKFEKLEFYIYLFDPEEFILIKNDDSLIALSQFEKDVIVCNKKKNSYIKVAKDEGVQIHNEKGEVVNVNSTNGVIINGKNLSQIISGALKPLSNMFNKQDY
ncbi:MAG: hypothetical protein ACFFDW_04740 [Candidatus Thorarchaeota archaeon]